MKKTRFLFLAALPVLVPLTALAAPAPVFSPGTYSLTAMTEWDKIANDQRGYSFLRTLPGKPAGITDVLSDAQKAAATYAGIKLGTAGQLLYLVFGRAEGDNTNVDYLYVDADNNHHLDEAEKIELKKNSPFGGGEYELQITEAVKPVLCAVDYARRDGTIATRRISLSFQFIRFAVTSGKGSSATTSAKYLHQYLVETWISGTARFKGKKGEEKEALFGLIDGDDDGVFSEFGRDVVLVDANGDGRLDMEKEASQLLEFCAADEKDAAQYRLSLAAWPETLLVRPARDAVDPAAVEMK